MAAIDTYVPELTAPPVATAPVDMVIDRVLPTFDVTRIEHRVVDAPLPRTWQALRDLDLLKVHTPVMDAAFFVRGLPERIGRLLGRDVPDPIDLGELKLVGDGSGLPGWVILGEVPQREIAFGAVGRFWDGTIHWLTVPAEGFADFDDPGWGRIAANLSLRPYGERRTLLSYEARTATTDPDSRRRFSRYWLVVEPFVGHIMRAVLATVARDAEVYD